MKVLTGIIVLLIGVIVAQMCQNESINIQKSDLTAAKATLTQLLNDTTQALAQSRGLVASLGGRVTKLMSLTANQAGQLLNERVATSAIVHQAQALQAETDRKLKATVDQLTNAEQARDAAQKRDGPGPLGKGDSANVAEITALKQVVTSRDSTIRGLRSELVQQEQETGRQKSRAEAAEDRESDLERELNNTYYVSANRIQEANNRPYILGINRGKRIREAINEVRAGRIKRKL